jgi:hypothetical protein
MAKRILPYRDYSEHDVLNLFSLAVGNSEDLTTWVEAGSGKWDSGVVVEVSAGATLPGDLPSGLSEHGAAESLRKYLGASQDSAHIGYNAYPYNGMTVVPSTDGAKAVGITLRETLAYDENGEKLLYYKQKLDEAFAVLPGQTVPVLTRGTVLLTVGDADSGITLADVTDVEVGSKLIVNTSGVLTVDAADTTSRVVGTVLALGKNSGVGGTSKALCRISF